MAPGSTRLVVDTDVLIDYLRGQEQAVGFLEGCEQALAISVITIAELYAGVRDGTERQSREVAAVAGLWRRQYGRSHGTGLADALIAASVEAAQPTLVTLNRRHFPMLASVWVPYAKPGSA